MIKNIHSLYKIISLSACFCLMLLSLVHPTRVAATDIVAAFGDSITTGWPYKTDNGDGCYNCGGYEIYLQDLFNQNNMDIAVFNYGVPGETAGDGLNRIDSVMLDSNADYVLLMEGTNDLSFFVDPATVAYMLYQMAWKVHLWGKKPILATITPDTRYGQDWKNVGIANSWIRYYARISSWIRLSNQYDAILPYWDQGYNYDGLHPNWSGYWIMARTWFHDLTGRKYYNLTGRKQSGS